jgi:hypothetical protein
LHSLLARLRFHAVFRFAAYVCGCVLRALTRPALSPCSFGDVMAKV